MPAGLGVEGDEVRRGCPLAGSRRWRNNTLGSLTSCCLASLSHFLFPADPRAAVRCLRGVWGRGENGNRFLLALVKEG